MELIKPTRRGLITGGAALAAFAALPRDAEAQLTTLGAGPGGAPAGGGGGSQTTLWNTVVGASALATITNGDKTLTAAGGAWTSRRATTALTGDCCWQIEVLAGNLTADWIVLGAARACADDYLSNYGGAASGGGFQQAGGLTPAWASDGYTFAVGDLLWFYWKHAISALFMSKNNASFYGSIGVTDDPTTPTGGYDLSATTAGGAIYPAVSVAGTDQVLLRAGANIVGTPISGFPALP